MKAIVLTTIHIPRVLQSYIDNCRHYGHRDVVFVIIGDLKTPPQCAAYLSSLKKSGYRFVYLGPREQEAWLKDHKDLRELLPYNSVQRRNIGYLYAAHMGAEIIISIDDDNYCRTQTDYIRWHSRVGRIQEVTGISSSGGWVNLCAFLKTSPPRQFYHRGFPLNKRWLPSKTRTFKTKKRAIVNAGFWLNDPDVDTITRLEEPFKVARLQLPGGSIGLGPGTWHPFNSQNTAFHREILPCAFLITLGKISSGLTIDNFRFDDIWMSYFIKKASDKMGDVITFGEPMVEQRRNRHDLLMDLEREFLPSLMTPKLVAILEEITLKESCYAGLYDELASKLEHSRLAKDILVTVESRILKRAVKSMRVWLKSCAKLKLF